MPIRRDIIFTGRVQGVGFRATTRYVAKQHVVTGWIRNEPDGSVRCVVEGEPDELDRFIAAVQRHMTGCVDDTRISTLSATGEFIGFDIRR